MQPAMVVYKTIYHHFSFFCHHLVDLTWIQRLPIASTGEPTSMSQIKATSGSIMNKYVPALISNHKLVLNRGGIRSENSP
jgi:hypothetical protein